MKSITDAKKILVIDVSNLLFRVASVQKFSPYAANASVDELVAISFQVSLQSIAKYYRRFKPDFLIFAFDGDNNWRKTYTEKNKSRLPYKGNRVRDPAMEHYYRLLKDFNKAVSAFTSICCIKIDTLEADDAIAGICQMYATTENEITIVSGDKDFTQLLKLPNVKLVNPDDGKCRNTPGSKDYEPDIDYWIFKKCVRGDGGDHVPSVWPRVREDKIKAAYKNDFDRLNFMNHRWSHTVIVDVTAPDGSIVPTEVVNNYRVGDLFEENKILMDLSLQPPEQRALLEDGIKLVLDKMPQMKYSHFNFVRFLAEYGLEKVQQDAIKFTEMFTNNQRFIKGEKTDESTQVLTEKKEKLSPLEQLKLLKQQNSKLLAF